MVNNTTHPSLWLSPYSGGNRTIKVKSPLYCLKSIQEIALVVSKLYTVTNDSASNIEDLGWDLSDVALLIRSLKVEDYLGSEWCHVNGNLDRPCDSYAIGRLEYNEDAKKDLFVKYYIKRSEEHTSELQSR